MTYTDVFAQKYMLRANLGTTEFATYRKAMNAFNKFIKRSDAVEAAVLRGTDEFAYWQHWTPFPEQKRALI